MESFNESSPYPKCTERKDTEIFRQKKAMEPNSNPKNFPSSLPQIYPSIDSSFLDMRKEEAEIEKSDSVSTFSDEGNISCNENSKILMDVPNCSIDVPNISIISTSVPCRNLMDQFDTLEISLDQEDEMMSPEEKLKHCKKEQSPAGVDAFISFPGKAYDFKLHKSLQLSLTQSIVDRVSFYGVIHDINKEATSMAANDTKQSNGEEVASVLLQAVNSQIQRTNSYTDESYSPSGTVLIDQEDWLLDTINSSSSDTFKPRVCPPGFAIAIGEEEPASAKNNDKPFENTIADSKTQLWKPSRSWWEARSGKNPWIEPNSHNKRWRYLWPLIHYHKFLTKCIKKLKRHSIDVRSSESPVCAFLREEVCAVSEHLATVSKFSADEWVESLRYFNGWTDQSTEAEAKLRARISGLKLKSVSDDVDLNSPLLRKQIDKFFLKAMADAKDQMINGVAIQQKMKSIAEEESCLQDHDEIKTRNDRSKKSTISNPEHSGVLPTYLHRQNGMQQRFNASGLPPKQSRKVTKQGRRNNRKTKEAISMWTNQKKYNESMYAPPVQNPMMYQTCGPYGYYPAYESYGHPPSHGVAPFSEWEYPPNPVYQRGFNGYGQMPYPPQFNSNENGPMAPYGPPCIHPPYPAQQSPMTSPPESNDSSPTAPPTPGVSDSASDVPISTPFKQTPSPSSHPHSPFWGHLDQGTLAMAGLMTPGGLTSPHNPMIGTMDDKSSESRETIDYGKAQLWMNPTAGYYQHQQHGVPPSPATQFMMSNISNPLHFPSATKQATLQTSISNEGKKKKDDIVNPSQNLRN